MKYPDASKMRYPDASKPRAGIPQVKTPKAAPAKGKAASAVFAPAAAAQSGNLPPPANAAAAAGNSPLIVPQAAMVVGEPIPVIWGRRRGNVGGVLVFPRATEARFENTSSTVTSRYHMVLGEGLLPDVQVRDVRMGECRIGSFSQNYDKRAGSWTPGNFAVTATGYTVPTFPTFTGGGGNYSGLSTFEAGATFPGGSDDWRTGWNVFLRGGTIVERGRLLDSTVDSSDNVADLVLWALQQTRRVPDALIDLPSLVAAARFTEANGLWCNGEFSNSANLGDWLIGILPQFLLRETKIAGKFGLRPLVPTNSDGTIKTTTIVPEWVLTEASIKPGTYQIEYTDTASSRPTPLAMLWRQQHDDTDVPIVRTLAVGDPNAPGPPEQHDLSQFATSENHAAKVGVYKFTRRTLSTHTASVVLSPGNQTGLIVEGDIVQIYLQVITSREPESVINRCYVVESVGHNLAGEETLSLSHFPVNSSGQSLIALAVAAAAGTGTILPSNRTGSSCDLPGAASDTSVPAKTTSGTAFSSTSGGGGGGGGPAIDPNGGAGPPTDSPPNPNEGAAPYAGEPGEGPVPGTNDPTGSICPYGATRVTGRVTGGTVVSGIGLSAQVSFTAFSLPIVTRNGEPYDFYYRQIPYKVTWFGWVGAEFGPPAAQVGYINALEVLLPGTEYGTPTPLGFEAAFTCRLANGTPDTPTPTKRLHPVEDGETFPDISQKYYGTPNRGDDIRNANPWILGLQNWGLRGLVLEIPN
jgi:hypothetical protein